MTGPSGLSEKTDKEKEMKTTLTFYGHAAFRLVTNEIVMLIDPFLKGNPVSPVTPEEVHPDYILVTHGHGDHLGDTIAIAKRTGATVISNAEICDWLYTKDINTHAQHIGGGFSHPFGYLKLTQAVHGSAIDEAGGFYGGNPAGLLLTTLDGRKIYHAGDTGLFGDMKLIGEEGVTVAILPIGDNYTMGPDDALRAVKLIQPRVVIPIHYNTFPLLKQDVRAWKKKVEAETNAQVVILLPGESYSLDS
jgi:L-ascorbate metabolism protein UlaG (beta-lactamase superfamily)